MAERLRHRHDGWTPARQAAFLRALRECANVTEACAHVGLSTTSAYRARRKAADFAAAWDAALALTLPALERAAYQRAVEGWTEPMLYAGQVVAERRRYSDGLLALLLKREEVRAARRGRAAAAADAAETDAALRRSVERLRHRLLAEEAMEADRLRLAGRAP